MKWDNFEESSKELPEIVVEKLIEGFSVATKDLVQLAVAPVADLTRLTANILKTRFQFRVYLMSSKLPDYSFRVFEFGYNVALYPVKLSITQVIREELNSKGESYIQVSTIEDEEKFESAVKLVFKSAKFTEIVGGLMKIAGKKEELF